MQKIITDGSKFFIKSYDEAGNSTGISVAYDTEADAQAALVGVEAGSDEVTPEAPEVSPEAPVEVTETEQAPVVEATDADKKKEEEISSDNSSEGSSDNTETTPEVTTTE